MASVVTRFLSEACRSGVDFLAPPICLFCGADLLSGRHVAEDSAGDLSRMVCSGCQPQIPPSVSNPCQRCGAPLGQFQRGESDCIHCRGSRFAFSGVVSLGAYEAQLKTSCQQGKSAGSQAVVHALTGLLAEREQERIANWECTAVVNVPQFWANRLKRRIHPNETMATELSRIFRIPYQPRWLKQARKTEQQHLLPPTARQANVRNAYAGTGRAGLTGQKILLVDDILTTGATAHVCARSLRKGGADAVYVAVLARGLKRR